MNDRCDACRYFNDTGQYGECRYNPPKITLPPPDHDMRRVLPPWHSVWPTVERHWWCGKFQRAMGRARA